MAVGAAGIWMYAVIASVRTQLGVVGDGCGGCDPGKAIMRRTGGRAGLCGS